MHRRTLLAAPALLVAGAASAEDWPRRPIRVVVPFPAGSTADTIIRHVAALLGAALGQSVIVDNRAGANGTIGLAQGLRAAPDGYTLSLGSSSNMAAAPYMVRNLPYDPQRDLVAISGIYEGPTVVLAGANFPATNFAEFLAEVRARPGHYSYGYPHVTGVATAQSVATVAALDMIAVPYSSGPQMLTDLVGGNLPLVFTDVSSSLPLILAGRVKVFGISSTRRSAVLPDVPTLTSLLGHPIEFVGWGGFVVPTGTPRPIIERVNAEVNRILDAGDTQALLRRIGASAMSGTPEAFGDFIRAQGPLWTEALRAARIQPE